MELNWWEILCLVVASMIGFGGMAYIYFRLLVGWGMQLEKRNNKPS